MHPSAPITPSPVVQCALSRLGKDRLHGHLLLKEPRSSPVLENRRARAPATPARSRTFSPARRSPPLRAAPHNPRCSAFSCPPRALDARSRCCRSSPARRARSMHAAVAVEVFHLSPPLASPRSYSSHASAERKNLRSTAATLPKSKKWVRTEVASLLSRATDVPRLDKVSSLTDV